MSPDILTMPAAGQDFYGKTAGEMVTDAWVGQNGTVTRGVLLPVYSCEIRHDHDIQEEWRDIERFDSVGSKQCIPHNTRGYF